MFGRYLRAIGFLVAAPLIASFLKLTLGQIIKYMNAPKDSKLVTFFELTQQHFLLILLFSIGVMLLVGAAIERGAALPR